MERKLKERSSYFQSIARHFFKMRGAPFFLSSSELDCIARWEQKKIPLYVVLEGITRSFENSKEKAVRRSKILSIGYCDLHVLKAFEQHRERKVGHRKNFMEQDERRKRIKMEIRRFLETLSPRVIYLKEKYSQAYKMISRKKFNEEEYERIEGEIEELLLENALEREKNMVKKKILAEYTFRDEEEFMKMFRIKLVKVLRDKYKIPYISFYYY